MRRADGFRMSRPHCATAGPEAVQGNHMAAWADSPEAGKQVKAVWKCGVRYLIYASFFSIAHPHNCTTMSAEKARFAQEVAEVEHWWRVRSLACLHIPENPPHRHL